MDSKIKKISTLAALSTTMTTGCALFKDPAIGTWTMTSQENACKSISDDGETGEICFTFSDFDFTVGEELVSTVDQIGGDISYSYTYAGESESDTYSFTMTGDMDLTSTEEGYDIDVDGELEMDGEAYDAEVELNCTLTTNTELNCTLDEFTLDGDDTESYVDAWEFTFTKQ